MPNYALEQARWAPGTTVTWYYSGTSSAVFARQAAAGYSNPDLFPADIRAAFNRWDDVSGIRFQEVSTAAAANIVIGWGNIDGPLQILAQASYYYDVSTRLFAPPVQITFDTSELYNPTSGSERLSSGGTFYAVALHEIGHSIGLDHYSGGQAIMNPYITSLNDLTASDIAGVQALYGAGTSTGFAWDFNWRLEAAGDFNRDGTTDLIWSNGSGVRGGWLMANNSRAATLDLPYFPDWTAIGTGDFNGDGTTDILWQNSLGLVGEWFMGGAGTRQGTANIQAMQGWTVLSTGDFNGDGTSDIIWDNGAGYLGGWLMRGGQIAATVDLHYVPGWNLVATGDFNRDGTDDFIWQNVHGDVGEWLMAGGERAGTLSLGTMAGWRPLGSGDFNNDGCDDVLWRDDNGVTQLWLMNGGTVQQRIGAGLSANLNFVSIGDFNGDGRDDIMWQDRSSGSMSIWNMGSSGVVASVSGSMPDDHEFDRVSDSRLAFELDSFEFLPTEATDYNSAGKIEGLDMPSHGQIGMDILV